MEIFAYILALIWSILCLILFFKIWGMTDNVEQLAHEVHELKMALMQEHPEVKVEAKKQNSVPIIQSSSDISWDNLEIGDTIKLKSDGKLYKVTGFENNGQIRCEPL